MEEKTKGYYFGTEIDRKWWKRYKADSMFARGNGEFWMDEQGIHFRKFLTKKPLLVSWKEMRGAELGKWHAGRWGGGRPVMKIDFERNGNKLCAGFSISKAWDQMEAFVRDLNANIQKASR